MRAARKRFTRPRKPKSIRRKPVGDGTATSRYMNSDAGRAAMKEALGEQRRKQNGICAKCGGWLPWESTKFEYRERPDGVENRAIHKVKCPVNLGAMHEGGSARTALLLLFLFALWSVAPVLSHAQGGSISGQVVQPGPPNGTGGPAPFASVRVCPYAGGLGTPCSPTANLFLDPGLTVTSPNPATTDQYGNFSLWASAQPYIVQITPISGVTYSYIVMAVAGTVTSVGLSMPSTIFTVANSPITSSGTLAVTLLPQSAGLVFASPTNAFGLPTFRNSAPGDFGSQPANTVLGNCTGSAASPLFCTLSASMIPGTLNATSFSGNVGVNGSLSATGTLIAGASTLASVGVSGPVTVGSTLGVAGTSTLSGSATVGGTLGVTGAVTLSSTLNASGAITAPTINSTTGYQINGSYGTSGQCLISTGTGTAYNSNCTRIYVIPGVLLGNNSHIIYYAVQLSGGTGTVTFTGGGAFSTAGSYFCSANDETAIEPVQVVTNSGSLVTFNGTGSDIVGGVCAGD